MNLARFIPFALFFVLGLIARAQAGSPDEQLRQAYEAGEKATQQNNLAAAEKAFLRVLELVPRDVGARVNLGVVCMREQKWSRALEYLNEAQKLAPQVPGIRLNIGLVHYRKGDYAAAIPEFESVLRQQPDSIQARRLLGLCYLFEEQYAEAAADLEPLWQTASGDASYLYSLAVAADNAGRPELSERAVNQLMATAKDSPLVNLLLGKAYLAHEQYTDAVTELQKAARVDSKLPMLHYNLGIVYRRQGELEKARSEFLEDAALEPDVAFNYDQLGLLASSEGKNHEAEVFYSEAVKRDHKLGTSWFGLAKAYKQERLYPDALKALEEAGSLDPKSASVHYLRAQVLADMGRQSEAQTEFAKVRELNRQTVDQLEREISGAKYRDPELPAQ